MLIDSKLDFIAPRVIFMPKELRTAEQFEKLMPKGLELRVVRSKQNVKLKLRTPEYLYTFKTNSGEAENIIKNAKDIEVIELGHAEEKAEDKKREKSDKTD